MNFSETESENLDWNSTLSVMSFLKIIYAAFNGYTT